MKSTPPPHPHPCPLPPRQELKRTVTYKPFQPLLYQRRLSKQTQSDKMATKLQVPHLLNSLKAVRCNVDLHLDDCAVWQLDVEYLVLCSEVQFAVRLNSIGVERDAGPPQPDLSLWPPQAVVGPILWT